mmetsp:Transcript_59141/g.152074  ORF Transcript_59141/g.152074 Transcript_59141/m.152074 type:complete len:478 (+) Transcript_59141:80-1513(+)
MPLGPREAVTEYLQAQREFSPRHAPRSATDAVFRHLCCAAQDSALTEGYDATTGCSMSEVDAGGSSLSVLSAAAAADITFGADAAVAPSAKRECAASAGWQKPHSLRTTLPGAQPAATLPAWAQLVAPPPTTSRATSPVGSHLASPAGSLRLPVAQTAKASATASSPLSRQRETLLATGRHGLDGQCLGRSQSPQQRHRDLMTSFEQLQWSLRHAAAHHAQRAADLSRSISSTVRSNDAMSTPAWAAPRGSLPARPQHSPVNSHVPPAIPSSYAPPSAVGSYTPPACGGNFAPPLGAEAHRAYDPLGCSGSAFRWNDLQKAEQALSHQPPPTQQLSYQPPLQQRSWSPLEPARLSASTATCGSMHKSLSRAQLPQQAQVSSPLPSPHQSPIITPRGVRSPAPPQQARTHAPLGLAQAVPQMGAATPPWAAKVGAKGTAGLRWSGAASGPQENRENRTPLRSRNGMDFLVQGLGPLIK